MKQTLLSNNLIMLQNKLRRAKYMCIAVVTCSLIVNILLVIFHSEKYTSLFFVINVVLDVLCCWFVMLVFGVYISPRKQLVQLCSGSIFSMQGTVQAVSNQTTTVRRIACSSMIVDGKEVFLPQMANFAVQVGDVVSLQLSNQIVVEVEK